MQLFHKLFFKPHTTQLEVTSPNGFHLRPAARFAKLAQSFSCEITASFQGKTVNAKKVNALLSLSLERADTFRLTTQGKEAEQALKALQKLFASLMQHDPQTTTLSKESSHYKGKALEGEIITPGVAIAPTVAYQTTSTQHKNSLSFADAVAKSLKELEDKSHKSEIYAAQKELLLALLERADSLKELEAVIQEESNRLQETALSSKRADYADILQLIKQALGLEVKMSLPEEAFILLADDLLPSEIGQLSSSKVEGVILKETSINSHSAILLRASGIPSLIANTSNIPLQEEVILDASAGVVVLHPDNTDKKLAQNRQEQLKHQNIHAASRRFEAAVTSSGKRVRVFANVGDVQSARTAKEEGAEGIGLLRSEFLFQTAKPTLQSQVQTYREIFENFDEITVRTLDVGGDKALPYLHIPPETNPFLGIRGVRLFRTHPKILQEQLHAIFLAAKCKRVKVMFPMVSTLEEFTQAKAFAHEVATQHHLDISHIDFGIMIEVPSVLFLLEAFNEVVDFYSVGTNDLTQYLFAIERTHPLLKADASSTALFAALEHLCKRVDKPLSICGELAANSDAVSKLLHLGFDTLSVSPKHIAQTKEIIRHV